MKKALVILFWTLSILLWGAALCFVLEATEAVRTERLSKRVRDYAMARNEEACARNQEILENSHFPDSAPPADMKRDLPSRDTFAQLEEAGRQKFADERRELICVVAPSGQILSCHAGGDHPTIQHLTAKAEKASQIAEVLDAQTVTDCMDALAAFGPNNTMAIREYPVTLADGTTDTCTFRFRFLGDNESSPSSIAVFIGLSKYLRLWAHYRPNYYQNSDQDALYPQYKFCEFWTNSLGFRDREMPLSPIPGTVRIVCYGGSTTVEGPRNDLTYPKYLERRLRDALKNDNIEVVNCGTDGLCAPMEVAEIGGILDLKPDLVIQYSFVNDISTAVSVYVKEYEKDSGGMDRVRQSLRKSRFLESHFKSWLLPARVHMEKAIKKQGLDAHQAIWERARSAGVRVAACSIAYPNPRKLPRIEYLCYDIRYRPLPWGQLDIFTHVAMVETYNRLLKEMCDREGTLYVPVAENLAGGTETFADPVHLNVKGIEEKADIIFEAIRPMVEEMLQEKSATQGTS